MATSHRAPSPGQDRNYGLKGFCLHSSHLMTQKTWILHTRRKSSLVANLCSFYPGKDNFVDSLDTFAQLHGCSGTVEGLYTCCIWVEGWTLWTQKVRHLGFCWKVSLWTGTETSKSMVLMVLQASAQALYIYVHIYKYSTFFIHAFMRNYYQTETTHFVTFWLLWYGVARVFFWAAARETCFFRELFCQSGLFSGIVWWNSTWATMSSRSLFSFLGKTTAVCSWDPKWRWDVQLSISQMIRRTADSISGIFDPKHSILLLKSFSFAKKENCFEPRAWVSWLFSCWLHWSSFPPCRMSLVWSWTYTPSQNGFWYSHSRNPFADAPDCGHQDSFLFWRRLF